MYTLTKIQNLYDLHEKQNQVQYGINLQALQIKTLKPKLLL